MPARRILARTTVRGFKALRDVAVSLAPFTVVVGGNAAGKSSLLDAIALLQASAAEPLEAARAHRFFAGSPRDRAVLEDTLSFGLHPRVLEVEGWIAPYESGDARPSSRAAAAVCGVKLDLTTSAVQVLSHFQDVPYGRLGDARVVAGWTPWSDHDAIYEMSARQRAFGMRPGPNLRLDPRVIALPSPIKVGEASLGNDGSNLAAVLRDIRDREDGTFGQIEDSLRRVVPVVRQLRVRKVDWLVQGNLVPSFGVEARIGDGPQAWCPASELSEGTLITLALLTATFVADSPTMVLLDDIDRGLHPRAQRDLIELLRGVMKAQSRLQIICTTHSPYTVDSFALDEVVALKLDEHANTHAQRLSEHPDAAKWRDLMEAGEFWTSVSEDWVFGG